MATITCALLWVLTPLLIVLVAIAWILETDRDRARRWRRQGLSQQRIANRLGCSRWKVRQMLA
jgi:cytochrome c-type biogenesis protein CcmH/NrfF